MLNGKQEPNVHFKYIEAAAKMQQFKEVERVCRDSTVYEAEKVGLVTAGLRSQDQVENNQANAIP